MEAWKNELYHHGILGQKWGVRRYQNEDGSYTPAGRKRYGLDLDINDRSRRNIAKIRKGEAYRRLDKAKENNPTNNTRIAELQGRVRGAKKAERQAKRIDKGAALAAKGQTIGKNNMKAALAYGAAYVGSNLLTMGLNRSLRNLQASGQYRSGHYNAAKAINTYGQYAMFGAAFAYNIKKGFDNTNLRAYNNARLTGDSTIRRIGSSEYKDVVNRRKKNG
jgi:hypothetical protein